MFINTTDTLGVILGNAVQVSVGSLIVALLIIFIVLTAFCLMFGIPIEYSSVIMLPMILAYMAYYQEFYVTGGAIFIYLAFLITKNWLFK